MPTTLSCRPRTVDVRDDLGVTHTVTFAHCTCPDQSWRDVRGVLHFCKHIVHVYANYTAQMRKHPKNAIRVPSFTTPGLVYVVTPLHCPCPDFRAGVLELCEDLIAAYTQIGGFPAKEPVPRPAKAKGKKAA